MLTQFANSYIICENVQRVVARENRIQGIYVTVCCIHLVQQINICI